MDDSLTDPFDLLADETRVGILVALSERLREESDDPHFGFSELRKRVGVRDSSNFNYHLKQLRDRFVERADDGYRLTPQGGRIVGRLVAERTGEPFEAALDSACPACGSDATFAYADGVFTVSCPNDHWVRGFLPGHAVEGGSTDDAIEVATALLHRHAGHIVRGLCPICYGRLDASLSETGDERMPYVLTGTCSECGLPTQLPLGVVALQHPRIAAFFHERGIDVRETPIWELSIVHGDAMTVESDEPPRVAVVDEIDGDRLSATIDADGNVTELETDP